MDFINWNDSFSVGVGIVDEQHKQLIDIINELALAINLESSHVVLRKNQDKLLDYTDFHFRTEERLFAIHSNYKSHCEAHRKFEKSIRNLHFDTTGSNKDEAFKLLENLKSWLLNHILKTDMECFSDLGHHRKDLLGNLEERLQLLVQKDKVLIVENEATQRQLLKSHIEREGFSVLSAVNGVEAMEILNDNPSLRLVITDLYMPKMDGLELIQNIRDKHSEYIYIIVITISSDRKSLIQSFQMGANDYLQKPLFAQELTLRLKNGQRLLRLQGQDDLIFSMAKLADRRSSETGKHLERVKEFTLLLGQALVTLYPELGVTENVAKDISRVSPLHDIGKVGIADGILNKPGKLTREEFTLMQEHCRIGADLLNDILRKSSSKSLRFAYEITLYHHEKWDGSGYPISLSGEDIPLPARIMALADVYDALTSERVYKEAYDREKAKEIILESSGSHFDPKVVEAFKKVEDHFHKLRVILAD